jgi:N-acetyl-anhydromuramyl-L-alanine amidase AmpD
VHRRAVGRRTTFARFRPAINAIVIHDTEGRFIGSVRVLQRARTRGSAHFVVSRRGQIVQLVPVTDVAWHAGNAWWNLHSIGIEHEGWAGRRAY